MIIWFGGFFLILPLNIYSEAIKTTSITLGTMFQKEINFDRFVRGAMLAGVVLLLGYAINALSSVLLPFVLAWMLAYMLNPVVTFLQERCRLRHKEHRFSLDKRCLSGKTRGILCGIFL